MPYWFFFHFCNFIHICTFIQDRIHFLRVFLSMSNLDYSELIGLVKSMIKMIYIWYDIIDPLMRKVENWNICIVDCPVSVTLRIVRQHYKYSLRTSFLFMNYYSYTFPLYVWCVMERKIFLIVLFINIIFLNHTGLFFLYKIFNDTGLFQWPLFHF